MDTIIYYSDLSEPQILKNITTFNSLLFKTNKKLITKVIIGNSVTKIEDRCFENCYNLTYVKLSDKITSIGYNCFSLCYNLINIELNEKLLTLNDACFKGCFNICNIKIPKNVCYIGNKIFQDCTKLKYIVFENQSNIKECGYDIFKNIKHTIYITFNDTINYSYLTHTIINLIKQNNIDFNTNDINYYTYINSTIISDINLNDNNKLVANKERELPSNNNNIASITVKYYTSLDINTATPVETSVTTQLFNTNTYDNFEYNKYIPYTTGSNYTTAGESVTNRTYNSISLPFMYIKEIYFYNQINMLPPFQQTFENRNYLELVTFSGGTNIFRKNVFKGCSNLKKVIVGKDESINYNKQQTILTTKMLDESASSIQLTKFEEDCFDGCQKLNNMIIYNPSINIEFPDKIFTSSLNTLNIKFILYRSTLNSNPYTPLKNWEDAILKYKKNNIKYNTLNQSVGVISTYVRDLKVIFTTIVPENWIILKYDDNTYSYNDCFDLPLCYDIYSYTKVIELDNNSEFFANTLITKNITANEYNSAADAIKNAYKQTDLNASSGTIDLTISADVNTYANLQDKQLFITNSTHDEYTGTITDENINKYINDLLAKRIDIRRTNPLQSLIIKNTIVEIILNNNLMYIPPGSFNNMTSLTSINISTNSKLTELTDLFYNCVALNTLIIPSNVKHLGTNCFSKSGIINLDIKSNLISIGDFCFNKCTRLVATFPFAKITSIGYFGFKDCIGLQSTIELSNIIHLDMGAFYNCTSLSKVILPENITYIGNYCFKNCSSLTEINIPSKIKKLSDGLFSGCTNLSVITIPSTISHFGNNCFENCKLSSIIINDNVTYIGDACFKNCAYMTSIIIPKSVTYIGKNCFEGCTSLTTITFQSNKNIKSLNDFTFSGCNELTTIIVQDTFITETYMINNGLPESINNIGSYCFYGCSKLTKLMIPPSITILNDSCFRNCNLLANVSLPNNLQTIGSFCFSGCYSLIDINLPQQLKIIQTNAFAGCNSFSNITIPKNVTTIEKYAFMPYILNTNLLPSAESPIANLKTDYLSLHPYSVSSIIFTNPDNLINLNVNFIYGYNNPKVTIKFNNLTSKIVNSKTIYEYTDNMLEFIKYNENNFTFNPLVSYA